MEFEMRKVCILTRSGLQHDAFYSLPREPRGFWKRAFPVSVEHGHLQLIFISFQTFFLLMDQKQAEKHGRWFCHLCITMQRMMISVWQNSGREGRHRWKVCICSSTCKAVMKAVHQVEIQKCKIPATASQN